MPNTGAFAIYRADVNDPRRGAEGVAWGVAIGGAQDAELQLLRTAALSRLPMYCPDDALDDLGKGEFLLARYPGESHATYRARLVKAFAIYSIGGSAGAIIESLQAYGFKDVLILPVWQAPGPFPPETSDTSYSEFYVFLGPDFGTTGVTTSLSDAQVHAVIGIALKWKASHALPIKIVLQTSGVAGAPTIASGTSYPIGRTLGDTLPALGDPDCIVGGFFA